MYAGETLTLRGVTLIQAGVDGAMLDEVEPVLYPPIAAIIDGSSDEMAEALLPVLYAEFQRLQEEGVMGQDFTDQDFLDECAPARDFYTDDDGNLVFFLPPMLMAEPSLDAPTVSFAPEELNDILARFQE